MRGDRHNPQSTPLSLARALILGPVILVLTAGLAYPPDAAAGGGREVQEEFSRSVPADRDVHFELSNVSGETIIRSWDRDEVLVDALLTARAGDFDEARGLLRKLSVDVTGEGDHIVVTARYPRRESTGSSLLEAIFSGLGGGTKAMVDFDIRVPAEASLSISTVSGDVEVRSVAGPVEVDCTSGDVLIVAAKELVSVDCTSGDIEISRAGGEVRISATSGDMILVSVEGRVAIGVTSGDVAGSGLRRGGTISAISGDVELADTEGGFSVSSTSGDVVLDGHRGSLDVSTSSGDISVTVNFPLGDRYRIDASSGSVYFGLPEGASCQLDISTAGGSIHARYPMEVQEVRRNRLVAVAGDGDAHLEITTASGDVEVRER